MVRCVALLMLVLLTGCETIGFYSQAAHGQASLLLKRRAIDRVVEDDSVPQATRDKLLLVKNLRAFAADELALPVGGAYSSYVATGKPYVVWNVFAAPEFSLEMKSFCYPVAGCVSYRGYFGEAAARQFAARLSADGYDVFVGGIAAYSTLGWFADPVLDTFLMRSDIALAQLLFHELAHRVLYVAGDTRFSESFATAVAEVGLQRWLAMHGEVDSLPDHAAQREQRLAALALIDGTRDELAKIYAGSADIADKRRLKAAAFERLQQDYRELRATWQEPGGYSGWLAGEPNNARLGTIADYNQWVPAFRQLLQDVDGDLPDFYAAVELLAGRPQEERDAELAALMPR